jgi:hypothetical protein
LEVVKSDLVFPLIMSIGEGLIQVN